MRVISIILVVFGILFPSKRKNREPAQAASTDTISPAVAGQPAAATSDGAVVIEFTDPDELERKLREVRTGQRFEIRDGRKPAGFSSGITCSDKEAVTKYEKK